MFFVPFYDFFVHISGWRGSERVLGALMGALKGGRGAVEVPKNVKKSSKIKFSKKLYFG